MGPTEVPSHFPEDLRGLRTDRFERLVGSAALCQLKDTHITVVGVGGVGSFAVEALARSGVGHLTLVDGETVSPTNLNRQLHALRSTLGEPKVAAMKARLLDLADDLTIDGVFDRYTEETADRILPTEGPQRPHLVIDAIDNVTAKMHLIARCRHGEIPIVSCMGAGGRLDPTKITWGDLADTRGDHLARDIRKFLRKRHGIDCSKKTGIIAVWSQEMGRKALSLTGDGQGGIPDVNMAIPGIRPPKCQASAVFVTAAMGMTAAAIAIEKCLASVPK